MSNSFFYFFSAVPQVLAGILALFGVFVIFKIQTLKIQLIGIGQSVIDEVKLLISRPSLPASKRLMSLPGFNTNAEDIKRNVFRNDINGLKSAIDDIDKQHFGDYQLMYNELYESLKSLVKNTICWSIFTAAIIIICLTTIPFGDLILKHIFILYTLFIVVIICIIICFYGLISILKKSLNNSQISLFPEL